MIQYSPLICKFGTSKLISIQRLDRRYFDSSCSLISYFKNNLSLRNSVFCNKFPYRTTSSDATRCEPTSVKKFRRILKVAIVGLPNAGKSTLINQIIGRNVFPVSSKVHTTRCRARAVMVVENTQLVFLDTPGVVSIEESVKYHLERPCIIDSEEAIKEADIVGVVHDVSNKYTMFQLSPKILRYLFLYPTKRSFLILNKVDMMKSKRELIDCVNYLTNGHGILDESKGSALSNVFQLDEYGRNHITESNLQDLILDQTGWPGFGKIFMISALQGDGVGDIQMYLMDEAKSGDWLFEKGILTDQDDVDVVERTVFAKLLDHLPNVVPYNIKIQLDYFAKNVDGTITAVVLLHVKNTNIMHLIKGKGGKRIKLIAAAVEQNLRSFYLNDVHIRLVIVDKQKTDLNKRKLVNDTIANSCSKS